MFPRLIFYLLIVLMFGITPGACEKGDHAFEDNNSENLQLSVCSSDSPGPTIPTPRKNETEKDILEKVELDNPLIADTAMEIASEYPGEYNINQVCEIYDTLSGGGWHYYSDPTSSERFNYANKTLQLGKQAGTIGAGDCDDFAILMSALIESIGGASRVNLAFATDGGGHAYTEVYLGKVGQVDELLDWLKSEYGVDEIPGTNVAEGGVWLNLDWSPDDPYPGRPYFEGERAVSLIIGLEKKVAPKIIPIIDDMESAEGWGTFEDGDGSSISIKPTVGRKGNALEMSYDLKEGGWVGISKKIDPDIQDLLLGIEGLDFYVYGDDGVSNTIELRMVYDDGTAFGISWGGATVTDGWVVHKAFYDNFHCLVPEDRCKFYGDELNRDNISNIQFVISNNPKVGDKYGSGILLIDQVQGRMAIPTESPWARAEAQRKKALAVELAFRSEMTLNQDVHMIGQGIPHVQIEGTELAVESLSYYETLAGKQALLHGMELLPRPIAHLTCNNSVSCVAFSPDGKRLALGGYDNTTRVLDADSGKELARMVHGYCVDSVIFSPDGRRLATTSENNIAWLWDSETGRGLVRTPYSQSSCIAFSPDGRQFATAEGSTTRLWDAETGSELGQITHDRRVISVIYSPNGNEFATASSDQVRIFDADTCRELVGIRPNSSTVGGIDFNPNGKKLAVASGNQAIIWDVETEKETICMEHDDEVISVLFSPDGRRLATASDDRTVTLWDSKTGDRLARISLDYKVSLTMFSSNGMKLAVIGHHMIIVLDVESCRELARIEHSGTRKCIAFSPDGTKLTAGGGGSIKDQNTAKLWDAETGEELFKMIHRDFVEDVAFSPDGKKIVTVGIDRSARLWDIQVGQAFTSQELNIAATAIAFSPDGEKLAVTSGNLGEDSGRVILWDAETYEELVRLDFNAQAKAIAFSSHGEQMAIAIEDGTMQLLNAQTWNQLAQMEHNSTIISMRFSNDGKRLAAAGDDGIVILWDLQTGKKLSEIKLEDKVNSASFTNDCRKVAMDGSNNTAKIWDVETGKELAEVKCDGRVFSVAFSSDGKRLATGSDDSTARIWDLSTGNEQASMRHDDLVFFVAFSPDGKRLVTGSMDATARIWDAILGEELEKLQYIGIMRSAAFSPDGRWLAIQEWGDNVSILPVSSDDLICQACSRLAYNLTSKDWWDKYCRDCNGPTATNQLSEDLSTVQVV